MVIKVTIECKHDEYSWSDDERVSREMKIDVNNRQVYTLSIGNTADAMLQDIAIELMSKYVEKEQQAA